MLGHPNLPGQVGFKRALVLLDGFLDEGRDITDGFGAEHWPQLRVLRGILDEERAKVAERLPASLRGPAPRGARETSDVLSFARRQLERWKGQEKTLIVTVPAPPVSPEALLAFADTEPGFLWTPSTDAAFAGVGSAHRVEVAGEDRFVQLRHQADQVWRTTRSSSSAGLCSRPWEPDDAVPGSRHV